MRPNYWNDATAYLSKKCPVMAQLIANYPAHESMTGRGDAFYTLMRSIVGQQISVKAADAVWNKLEARVKPITPQKIARVRETTLRDCGFSGQKVAYAKNLAQYFIEKQIAPNFFNTLSDNEVITELTSIKGIGRWSAEMFLMFHLLRPDVFPVQDIGLIKGLERHYNKNMKLTKPEILAYGARFSPYRSVATWYLWRSLDPVPVAY